MREREGRPERGGQRGGKEVGQVPVPEDLARRVVPDQCLTSSTFSVVSLGSPHRSTGSFSSSTPVSPSSSPSSSHVPRELSLVTATLMHICRHAVPWVLLPVLSEGGTEGSPLWLVSCHSRRWPGRGVSEPHFTRGAAQVWLACTCSSRSPAYACFVPIPWCQSPYESFYGGHCPLAGTLRWAQCRTVGGSWVGLGAPRAIGSQ